MADSADMGLKIALEGEKDFKRALADINSQFKVLGSEMKRVSSEFDTNDKSVSALTSRNQVLEKEIDKQKEKIEVLRQALENSSTAFGENDRRTQNWQIQLNNAQAALNSMQRELDSNNEALSQTDSSMSSTSDSAQDLSTNLENAGTAAEESEDKYAGLKEALQGIGSAMLDAVEAAASFAVELGRSVIDSYADYEQLAGGVETLFKDSSDTVKDYADNAYKTAGLSANEYMGTVTGFSASLISSLGGDTAKAAEYANMAIVDMSDNANKMGTDIESIKNAYQGFAKGQFTMLDNLKLGYGGTKSEMERLLADAEAISGVHYDISNYSDIIAAIHTIQTQMGITGTTAKEAAKTISGSISATKSAVMNLVTALGRDDADITQLCQNVTDSFSNVVSNISPVIQKLIDNLPILLDGVTSAVAELLPDLLSIVTTIFNSLLSSLTTLFPDLIPAITEAVTTVSDTIIDNLPLLISAGVQLIASLVQGLGDSLPTLIPQAVEAVTTIADGLVDNLSLLLDAATTLITGLAQGLINALPDLIARLPEIITGIVNFITTSVPKIAEAGKKLLSSLVDSMPAIIKSITTALPQIITGIVNTFAENTPSIVDAGVSLLTALITDLPNIITTIVAAIPQIVSGLISALVENAPKMVNAGYGLFCSIVQNVSQAMSVILPKIGTITSGIIDKLKSGLANVWEIGKGIVTGLWDGIKANANWLWDNISSWASGLWNGIKNLFGVHSPSTKTAWIGEMLMAGLSNALTENGSKAVSSAKNIAKNINEAMNGITADMSKSLPTSFSISTPDVESASVGYGNVSLTGNNFYIRDEQDIQSLAIEIASLTKTRQTGVGLRYA